MKLLFQKSLHSSAQILENGKIEAKAVLLSTDIEMAARIVAANDSFLIERAEWEPLLSDSHSARSIHEISRKDLNRFLGGSEGCAHLLDLGQELLTDLQKIGPFV